MDSRSGANLGQAHFLGSNRFGTGTFGCGGVRTQPEPHCSDPVWGMRVAFGVGASQTFSIMGENLGHLA